MIDHHPKEKSQENITVHARAPPSSFYLRSIVNFEQYEAKYVYKNMYYSLFGF